LLNSVVEKADNSR